MGTIIPETGTKISVKTDSSGLDALIDTIQGDDILSQVLSPAVEQLQKDKQALTDAGNNLANATAERIKSYQEQFIGMNQSIVTGTMQDTIFVDPQGDGETEVGATALSDKGFPYPIVIEKGSRSHWIGSPVLMSGGWRFIGQHPGTSPKPFVEPSLEYITRDLEEMIGAEVVSKFGE